MPDEDSRQGDCLLLVDTCGERGLVAVVRSDGISHEIVLAERAASSTLLGAIRGVLQMGGMPLTALSGIGVVNGPGSFTGVRVGLAVVKGLCASSRLPAVGISRLAVLAASVEGEIDLSVLRAGRDEFYVRQLQGDATAREWMVKGDQFRLLLKGRRVAFAEETLRPWLAEAAEARFSPLSVHAMWLLARERFSKGSDDVARLDANYVREEQVIFRQSKEVSQRSER